VARITILCEGHLSSTVLKGGSQALKNFLVTLGALGHQSTVVSLWSKDETEQTLGACYPADAFLRILCDPPPGLRCVDPHFTVAAVPEETKQVLHNLEPDVMLGFGWHALYVMGRWTSCPSLAYLGLPDYRLLAGRRRWSGEKRNNSPIAVAVSSADFTRRYLRARWRVARLRGVVDLALASDLDNLRRHAFVGRRGGRHYAAPIADTALPMETRPLLTKKILVINTEGSHSNASNSFLSERIIPYFGALAGLAYELKFVGRDQEKFSLPLPLEIAQRTIVQGFTTPIESEFHSARCLLMCSPLPFGSSNRVKYAMMCGTVPVVHAAVTVGIPELIHGENCLIGTDGPEFVSYLERLLTDDSFRHRLAEGARRTYEEEFLPESRVPVLRAILKQIGVH